VCDQRPEPSAVPVGLRSRACPVSHVSGRSAERILPLLVTVLACLVLYRSPWSASDLAISPDSFHYASAAQRFARLGDHSILVNGRPLPPAYPPFFAKLVLAPSYMLLGDEIGNGIYPVLFFGLVGVLAAYGIGLELSGPWGGLFAAIMVLVSPHFRYYSREIMTDGPACSLGLVACWLFLRIQERLSPRILTLAGLVVASAASLRVLASFSVVPFAWLAWSRRREFPGSAKVNLALLAAPLMAVHLLERCYNQLTFGVWSRNGHHFWWPVPFDYPELVFSIRYVRINVWWLLDTPFLLAVLWGGAGVLILRQVSRRSQGVRDPRPVLVYLLLAAGLPSLIHLFFFYLDLRLHMPLLTGLAVVGGAGLGAAIPESFRENRRWPAIAAAVVMSAAAIHRSMAPPSLPPGRIFASVIAGVTPEDAVVITGACPPYLEALAGGRRSFVPIARWVKFANTFVAPERVALPDPYPSTAKDARCAGLLAGGAYDVYPFAAGENLELIEQWIREGRSVWVDSSYVPAADATLFALRSRFELSPVPDVGWLGALAIRKGGPPSGDGSGPNAH